MGLKVRGFEFEPHPEGWFPLCVKAAEDADGQYGPRIKWTLESKERREDGTPFLLVTYTSFTASERSGLGKLLTAAGFDIPSNGEEFDTDDLLGAVIEGLVAQEETARGRFNNVKDVRARRKAQKQARRPEPDENDPFSGE